MPRTIYLPSDLIDTQALSFARTFTSKGCVLPAFETPIDDPGLSGIGTLGPASSVFAAGAFKLAEAGVVGFACAPVFGGEVAP